MSGVSFSIINNQNHNGLLGSRPAVRPIFTSIPYSHIAIGVPELVSFLEAFRYVAQGSQLEESVDEQHRKIPSWFLQREFKPDNQCQISRKPLPKPSMVRDIYLRKPIRKEIVLYI